jgi:hypothetical protein
MIDDVIAEKHEEKWRQTTTIPPMPLEIIMMFSAPHQNQWIDSYHITMNGATSILPLSCNYQSQ